jgi:hypothetical protein
MEVNGKFQDVDAYRREVGPLYPLKKRPNESQSRCERGNEEENLVPRPSTLYPGIYRVHQYNRCIKK